MATENEPFLSRWSRLKHEQERQEKLEKPAEQPPSEQKADEAPQLPPLESLTTESDFAPFMHPKVQDALRRVALKKLFSDPHFNVPDVNEAYSGDWTGGEPIPEEMLKQLEHARVTLFQEVKDESALLKEEKAEEKAPEEKAAPEAPRLQEARHQEAQAPGPEAEPQEDKREPKNEPGRQDA
jgi:hypothetical protein